ncbi:MAG: malate synthase G, partial [Deltaproteobacteria bacterium]
MIRKYDLSVAPEVVDFVEGDLLAGLAVSPDQFWSGLDRLVHELGPQNRDLLAIREAMQAKIDAWHVAHRGQVFDASAYQTFLREIGYLVPEGPDFEIETPPADEEIALMAGPQLVVPVMNARYAINAANARWGSLYDALYGTDALGDLPKGKGYDAERGARVVTWAKVHLDKVVPLANGSWADLAKVDQDIALQNPAQLVGWRDGELLLEANGLRLRVVIDPTTPVGSADPAGISDIIVEAALTAIMDCEDSVAAVDAEDKVLAWSNWLGLMKGTLSEEVTKGGKTFTRTMAPDLAFSTEGGPLILKGRALMLVRNVGHLMTCPAVLDEQGREVGEGLLDALMTVTAAMHDKQNSTKGAVYIVKPKMHGPEEVAFACRIFDQVEKFLGLPAYTVRLGIMDEERRTSANLKECIRAARHRVAFINTGFLDRTGDEIHTA